MSSPAYDLPNHDFGTLAGVTVDAEQRACRVIADNAETLEEFIEFIDALGICPDYEYQTFLRS